MTPTTALTESEVPDETEIGVYLVEDQPLVADAIGRAVATLNDIRLLGTSRPDDTDASIAGAADVIVIDLDLDLDRTNGDRSGAPTRLIRRIHDDRPDARLLALGGHDEVREALILGCLGHISKNDSFESLANGIRRIHRGEVILDRDAFRTLLASDPRDRTDPGLTRREREVLELIADGLRGRAIADHLTISIDTVRTHTSNVLAKLGAHSQLEAVAVARRLRLIPNA